MWSTRQGGTLDSGILRQLHGIRKENRRGLNQNGRGRGRYGNVSQNDGPDDAPEADVSFKDIVFILSPFFWPDNVTSRIRSSCTWLCVIFSKVCQLMAPLFLSEATDYVVIGDLHRAFVNVILFCSLRFAGGLFREIQGLIFLKVKQQAYMQLAVQAFTHVHSLSINWHISKKTGNVMRNMDRGTEASTTLVSLIFLYMGPTVIESISVVFIFLFHFRVWSLALIVLVAIAVFIGASIFIATWRRKMREENNTHDNDFHEKATESLINFETVKYFNAEKYEIARFSNSVYLYQLGAVKLSFGQSATSVIQDFIINLTICLSLFVAAVEVKNNRMKLGNFVAVITYVSFLFSPLAFVGAIYNGVSQGVVDVKGLLGLMNEAPEVVEVPGATDIPIHTHLPPNNASHAKLHGSHIGTIAKTAPVQSKSGEQRGYVPPSPSTVMSTTSADKEHRQPESDKPFTIEMSGLLASHSHSNGTGRAMTPVTGVSVEFRNVSFNYPAQPMSKGLKNVSFTIAAGQTLAIVGATGSGKTTISRLLFRFYDTLGGSVCLNGHDIKQHTLASVRRLIGVVPQDTVLFNDSILYNIKYAKMDATMAEIEAVAEAAQIRAFIELLPEKWETKVGERGLKLSGGEKQRVAIARCLLKNPPIVVLDEATSALDTITEASVQRALQVLGQNRTQLVIAHRLSTVINAHHILVLEEGSVVEYGTPQELQQKQDGRFNQLWKMQIESSHASV